MDPTRPPIDFSTAYQDMLLKAVGQFLTGPAIVMVVLGLVAITLLRLQGNRARRARTKPSRGGGGKARRGVAESRRIGDEGERAVAEVLRLSGLPHLNDLTLAIKDGTAQLDHVVLAGRAVICLETKNWNGTVYGSIADRRWTVFDRGGTRRSVQSPIWQNRRHVAALALRFPFPADVRSFAVMAGRAAFKDTPPQVAFLDELPKLLSSIASTTGATPPELRAMWRRLVDYRNSAKHAEAAARHRLFMASRERGEESDTA